MRGRSRTRRAAVVAAVVTSGSILLAGVPAQAETTQPATAQTAAPESTADRAMRPDDGVFTVTGRGWGHGRGMSQYGAAQAASDGVGYRKILRFYYPDTELRAAEPERPLWVRLGHDGGPVQVPPQSSLRVLWTTHDDGVQIRELPRHRDGCRVRSWRVVATSDGAGMRVGSYHCGSWRRYLTASEIDATGRVSFLTEGMIKVRRHSSDGPIRRGYRGDLRVILRDGQLRALNIVGYEEYLRSVVPSESIASWPQAALRAQAVASRSYAFRSAQDRGGRYFDVYDSTASQAYLGAVAYDADWDVIRRYEHDRTDTAVEATSGEVLFADHRAAYTEYGSSNGGWTADGGRFYLVAQRDGWDDAADYPRRRWTDGVSASRLEAWYPAIGRLREIRVTERGGGGPWGGRVNELLLVGTDGNHRIRGEDNVRFALGVNSSYLVLGS